MCVGRLGSPTDAGLPAWTSCGDGQVQRRRRFLPGALEKQSDGRKQAGRAIPWGPTFGPGRASSGAKSLRHSCEPEPVTARAGQPTRAKETASWKEKLPRWARNGAEWPAAQPRIAPEREGSRAVGVR
jgi:hypothetical protein